MVRILLADDHAVVREGVRSLLERNGHRVVAEASDGLEAVRLAQSTSCDVAVIDIGMPGLNGLDAARVMLQQRPALRIVLLTMYTEDAYVMQALRAGVRAYVLKTQAASDLLGAIQAAVAGETYLSPGISEGVIDAALSGNGMATDPLTARERQVLQLVSEGHTTKEVANVLGISVKTADTHRASIMRKLDIHETAGLVRYAVRSGLIRV
jgi:DNA-binding NarL/FixJ family response regulator